MKILEWEKNIFEKYHAKKITEFNELKQYLTSQEFYKDCFNCYTVTETEISDEDFYAAYVFDEEKIAGHKITEKQNTGWKTSVVFVASVNKKDFNDYFMHTSGGLKGQEISSFIKQSMPPMCLDQTNVK